MLIGFMTVGFLEGLGFRAIGFWMANCSGR